MQRVTFETNVENFNDLPQIITVIPLLPAGQRRPDDVVVLSEIAYTLRAIIYQTVNESPNAINGTFRTIGSRVRGKPIAANVVGGTSFVGPDMYLSELSQSTLLDIVDQIAESNTLITIYDLAWKFIIYPTSIRSGSSTLKCPRWVPKNSKDGWVNYEDSEGVITCAASALALVMFKKSSKRRFDANTLIPKMREIQTAMGWGSQVTIQEVHDFVTVYPKYRLTLIYPDIKDHKDSTVAGEEFDDSDIPQFGTKGPKHAYCLYLVYDAMNNHYGYTKTPTELKNSFSNGKCFSWCHRCCVYTRNKREHVCGEMERPVVKRKACRYCNIVGDHQCELKSCQTCGKLHDGTTRCIVYKMDDKPKEFNTTSIADKKKRSLWVYDIESRFEIVESTKSHIKEFELDEEGFYKNVEVKVYHKRLQLHVANFIYAKNVFTGEVVEESGDGCLERFMLYFTQYNDGYNTLIAHNSSGYDSRLLFEACSKIEGIIKIKLGNINPIMRGTKFISLKFRNVKIIDSLLHIKGSLRNLAKDYVGANALEKGHFPHMFNTLQNLYYVGPIPAKEYFDLSFSASSDKDIEEFDVWYDTWAGRTDWCFFDELKKYCINDVEVLAQIVMSHHEIALESTGISPWHYTTAPAYVHDYYVKSLGKTLELPDQKEDPQTYTAIIQDLAKSKYWAVLVEEEYWFAKGALRGGRTDIRKLTHTVSDEDWARGVRIRYQDICSQYPYQQAVHKFPVGTPTIYVYHDDYYVCRKHCRDGPRCDCPQLLRTHNPTIDCIRTAAPTKSEILADDSFFGIIHARVLPPRNIFHPVLVTFDDNLGKSLATCKEQTGTFTSIEFKKALEVGYEIVEIYRFDKYNSAPSLWYEGICKFYLEKMINSRSAPDGEELIDMLDFYGENFDMADVIQKSVNEGRWGKNPAKKLTAKIMANCGWGKHAQKPIMDKVTVFENGQEDDLDIFFENTSADIFRLKNAFTVGNRFAYKYSEDGGRAKVNLHDGYLPAALFVPAYGRLQLWDQLNKLGTRVLMNDTDSIVYIYDPQEYNIPEGSHWGQWEVEDIDSKNGGIKSFVGVGPKTYGIKCENGETLVKAKGLTLKRATKNLVNFDTMYDIVDHYCSFGDSKTIQVPQTLFSYEISTGITTRKIYKELKFQSSTQKGVIGTDRRIYPLGYDNVEELSFEN